MDLIHATVDFAGQVLAQGPNPSGGGRPPGADKVNTLLQWTLWIVTAVCIAGVLMSAGKMAMASRRGSGGEEAQGLVWVLAACIIVGSATSITTQLI